MRLINIYKRLCSKIKKAVTKLPLIIYYRFTRKNPNTEERWNRIWTGNTEYGDFKEVERLDFYKYVSSLLPNEKIELLDMGCGDGEFLTFVSNNIIKNGIDFSDQAIGIATSKINGDLWVDDVNNVEKAAGSFDIITILETLEHVDEPNMTLKEAHRLLRENGRIIVSVPLPDHDIHKSYYWPEFISLHVHSFNFESIKKILIDTGFSKIIDVSTDRNLVVMATKKTKFSLII